MRIVNFMLFPIKNVGCFLHWYYPSTESNNEIEYAKSILFLENYGRELVQSQTSLQIIQTPTYNIANSIIHVTVWRVKYIHEKKEWMKKNLQVRLPGMYNARRRNGYT